MCGTCATKKHITFPATICGNMVREREVPWLFQAAIKFESLRAVKPRLRLSI